MLRPGAAVGRDRPVHRNTGSAQVQGEDTVAHPQTYTQQGDKLSYSYLLRNIHRRSGSVFSMVCDTVLLYNYNIMLHTH